MKTLLAIALVMVTIYMISCTKDDNIDYTQPENLSGTTWKCSSGPDWDEDCEYALLIFTSVTTVEGWSKYIGEEQERDWTGTFSISNNTITMNHGGYSYSGSIEGSSIRLVLNSKTYVFDKL